MIGTSQMPGHGWWAVLLIALLLLAGCTLDSEENDGAPIIEMAADRGDAEALPDVPAPADAMVTCAVLRDERVPRETCESIARLERAAGAFNAPDSMVRDETTRIRFALDRNNDAAAAAGAVDALPGETLGFETRAGRYMRVTLSGQGFDVTPLDDERRDLFASPLASWEWDVTPREEGERVLTLRTFVELPAPEGGMKPVWEQIEDRRIIVAVTWEQQVADIADQSEAWLKRGENWLIALTAFVVALAGLWAALRAFGRKDEGAG